MNLFSLQVFLSSSTIDDDTMEEWLRRRKNECEFDENAMDMNYAEKFYLPSGKFENPLIPNASVKFKVSYSPEKGRHMVATEDIKAGCTRMSLLKRTTKYSLDRS